MKKLSLFLVVILSIACALSPKAAETAEPTTPPPPTETETPVSTPTPTPLPMTDNDFTEMALAACATLESALQDITNATNPFYERYSLTSDAYQVAVDGLSDLNPDESSAPNAASFMEYIQTIPGLYSDYGDAITASFDQSGLMYQEISFYAVIEEGKGFMVFANEEWHELVVEEDLKLNFYETKEKFKSVANQLNLGSCASIDPIFD